MRELTCAIYARVSDESQLKGDSIEHQIAFAKAYARRRAGEANEVWSIDDTRSVYVDEGITGTSLVKRQAVQRLIADARRQVFQIVIFKGISRFARDTVDALTMLRTLMACGVRVISIEENFDSQRDKAEFVFTIHSALAQAESEKTAIRVRVGAMEKAKTGRWNGRVPDGYTLDVKTKTLVIDETFAPVIREIFDLYMSGMGCRKIADYLNQKKLYTKQGNYWTQRNISRILRNPVYVGDVVYGRRTKRLTMSDGCDAPKKMTVAVEEPEEIVVRQDAHPGIIAREAFVQVAATLEERKGTRGRCDRPHLLGQGILRCTCGSSMTIKTNGRKTRYYRCIGQMEKGRSFCSASYLRADHVEQLVIQQMVTDVLPLLNFENVTDTAQLKGQSDHLERIYAERSLQHKRTQLLFDKYTEGSLSDEQFNHMNQFIKQRLDFLKEIEQKLVAQSRDPFSSEEIGALVREYLTEIAQGKETHGVHEMVRLLIESVHRVQSQGPVQQFDIRYRFG